MIQRNSDRDTWKLEHWDEYIKTVDFTIPQPLERLDAGHDLILFHNSSDEEFDQSMKRICLFWKRTTHPESEKLSAKSCFAAKTADSAESFIIFLYLPLYSVEYAYILMS